MSIGTQNGPAVEVGDLDVSNPSRGFTFPDPFTTERRSGYFVPWSVASFNCGEVLGIVGEDWDPVHRYLVVVSTVVNNPLIVVREFEAAADGKEGMNYPSKVVEPPGEMEVLIEGIVAMLTFPRYLSYSTERGNEQLEKVQVAGIGIEPELMP
ncbi:MAG: hypothetical protein K0S20_141 [Patescibacteria group bacterium]|jgi:hypothetical protein|nr:hypothetical protein [Patescibacteria group bacterium]